MSFHTKGKVVRHNVFFTIFVSGLIGSVGEVVPPTEAYLPALVMNVGRGISSLNFSICHMAIHEELVQGPFNLAIALECTLGQLEVDIYVIVTPSFNMVHYHPFLT